MGLRDRIQGMGDTGLYQSWLGGRAAPGNDAPWTGAPGQTPADVNGNPSRMPPIQPGGTPGSTTQPGGVMGQPGWMPGQNPLQAPAPTPATTGSLTGQPGHVPAPNPLQAGGQLPQAGGQSPPGGGYPGMGGGRNPGSPNYQPWSGPPPSAADIWSGNFGYPEGYNNKQKHAWMQTVPGMRKDVFLPGEAPGDNSWTRQHAANIAGAMPNLSGMLGGGAPPDGTRTTSGQPGNSLIPPEYAAQVAALRNQQPAAGGEGPSAPPIDRRALMSTGRTTPQFDGSFESTIQWLKTLGPGAAQQWVAGQQAAGNWGPQNQAMFDFYMGGGTGQFVPPGYVPGVNPFGT